MTRAMNDEKKKHHFTGMRGASLPKNAQKNMFDISCCGAAGHSRAPLIHSLIYTSQRPHLLEFVYGCESKPPPPNHGRLASPMEESVHSWWSTRAPGFDPQPYEKHRTLKEVEEPVQPGSLDHRAGRRGA